MAVLLDQKMSEMAEKPVVVNGVHEVAESLTLRASVLSNTETPDAEGGRRRGEKAIVRKIDFCLLPLLGVAYMLQFLDKQTLNFSSIMGIIPDLNLKGNDYTWASSAFYFGYLAFSYPASFLMVRLPLGKYLAVTCIVWAVVLAAHAGTQNFTGLFLARFFLGAAEASISPGFSLITGMWYTREEQPLRHGLWFFGSSIAVMFGALLGYGIAHIHGGIGPWRWLYIIFGLITLVWAVVLVVFLPNTPAKARFLSKEESAVVVDRVRRNQTGIKDDHFKWSHFREVLTDLNIWLVVLFQLTFSIPNGGLTAFSSLVMSGFGFSTFQVYLLNLPIGVIHGIFSVGATFLCSRFNGVRTLVAPALSIISLTGSILVRFGPNQGSRLFGLFIFIAYVAGFPISMSMISSNVAGFTKKSVATAMMFVAYTAGNIVGPFLFFPSEAPGYPSGFLAMAVCFGIAALSMVALRLLLQHENRRRDRLQTTDTSLNDGQDAHAWSDRTDRENLSFRYMY